MKLPRLRRSLLRWFGRSKRPLPWRGTKDPYAIWVSETMLQQTTVTTVIPYYTRFLARFPTLVSLAAADEDSVLSLWSGLGYYARARNLRLGAQFVARNHGGVFPRELEAALAIKGVGPYTARAVTSIAYGARAAVVDGNVRRVVSRLWAVRDLRPGRAQALADRLLSPRSPGNWNEAMMELGAKVCLPERPRCPACPIRKDCRGRARPEHWSAGPARPVSVAISMEMALIERSGRLLLVRNPEGGLLGGMYDLPHTGLARSLPSPASIEGRFGRVLRVDPIALATVRHTVTRHRIEATVFTGRLLKEPWPNASFHPRAELSRLPLSGLTRKALGAAGIRVERTQGP